MLEPLGTGKYYTDGWSAYERHIPSKQHEVGKRKSQRFERKHLRLRTGIKRLTRKTIRYFKSERMHDIVIGLFINQYEFKVAI